MGSLAPVHPLIGKIKEYQKMGAGNFHLFSLAEFLTLYEIAITGTGTPGTGARFEIPVPAGSYRFSSA